MKKRPRLDFNGRKSLFRISFQSLLGWGGLAGFLLGAAFLGWATAEGIDGYLRYANLRALETRAAAPADITAPNAEGGPAGMELKRFTEVNPFRANTPPGGDSLQVSAKMATSSDATLGDLSLTGTLPPEGAFFNSTEGLILLLRGDEVDGYELVEVEPDGVLFHKGDEEIFLRIQFSGTASRLREKKSASRKPPVSPGNQNIRAATPEKEGALDRELVNQLLMNPFEELKKLRLRPRMENGEAVGIEVRYIRKDSLFNQLGVSRGDVIQGVNGIQMRSMNDVANAISSLMGGSRFDVTVLRDGAPVTLSYTVR